MEQNANALPKVTLGQYKGLEFTRRVRPVSEKAVELEAANLTRTHAPFAPVEKSAARGMSTLRRPPALTWATAPCSPCGSAPSLPTGLRWNIIWMPSRRRMPSTPKCSRRWRKPGLPDMDFKLQTLWI